jgi:hypothetical protein
MAWMSEVNAELLYGTYLVGRGDDTIEHIATDTDGNVYVAGTSGGLAEFRACLSGYTRRLRRGAAITQ